MNRTLFFLTTALAAIFALMVIMGSATPSYAGFVHILSMVGGFTVSAGYTLSFVVGYWDRKANA